jgi:hypothetical protein
VTSQAAAPPVCGFVSGTGFRKSNYTQKKNREEIASLGKHKCILDGTGLRDCECQPTFVMTLAKKIGYKMGYNLI